MINRNLKIINQERRAMARPALQLDIFQVGGPLGEARVDEQGDVPVWATAGTGQRAVSTAASPVMGDG